MNSRALEFLFKFWPFNQIYFVVKKADGTLDQVLKTSNDDGTKLNEETIQYLVYQMVRALKHIHSANVMHRDLKPDNIGVLENDGLIQILDFGYEISRFNYLYWEQNQTGAACRLVHVWLCDGEMVQSSRDNLTVDAIQRKSRYLEPWVHFFGNDDRKTAVSSRLLAKATRWNYKPLWHAKRQLHR